MRETPSPEARALREARAQTAISVTDVFSIGIGPSSSHTVGPMRAAHRFVETLGAELARVTSVTVELYGSLALTGKGHCTDSAIILGLSGHRPELVDPDQVPALLGEVRQTGTVKLGGRHAVAWREQHGLVFNSATFLPGHPNSLRFRALSSTDVILDQVYQSIGGGAIRREGEAVANDRPSNLRLPHPFNSGAELLAVAATTGLSIAELMRANDVAWREPSETDAFLDRVRVAMLDGIERGCRNTGVLPGGLNVRRRAPELLARLSRRERPNNPLEAMDWVSLFALAVNEENAAGGRVVTAPTNGAAGVIPAVLAYYERFIDSATHEGSRTYLLTAAAIGTLYKKNASISAAEMGCQGEIGVACSMAAAGLAAVLGGAPQQIENAAEIGMEHHLGMTCDPIGGLVQIPCIERNTMGALKAINAAHLALHGDGRHIVSLDAVIETMRQTGEDMRSQYKETSLGGLAVNVAEC